MRLHILKVVCAVVLALSATFAQADDDKGRPMELSVGPYIVHVNQKPLKDLEFDACFAGVKFSSGKVFARIRPIIGEAGDRHCPDLKGFTENDDIDKYGAASPEIDPTTPESSTSAEFDSRKWKYSTDMSRLSLKTDSGWGAFCMATMRTTDNDSKIEREEVVTCNPVRKEVERDGAKKKILFCPKIKECLDAKFDSKKAVKVGDITGKLRPHRLGVREDGLARGGRSSGRPGIEVNSHDSSL